MFKNIGYNEMQLSDGEYISCFSSTKTKPGSESLSYAGSYLFLYLSSTRHSLEDSKPYINELADHLRELSAKSCMFSDFYWFVDLKRIGEITTTIDIVDLYMWLSSLYLYSDFDDYTSPYHTKYIIRSTQDCTFSVVCYKTVEQPSLAIDDNINICVDEDGAHMINKSKVIIKNGEEHIIINN